MARHARKTTACQKYFSVVNPYICHGSRGRNAPAAREAHGGAYNAVLQIIVHSLLVWRVHEVEREGVERRVQRGVVDLGAQPVAHRAALTDHQLIERRLHSHGPGIQLCGGVHSPNPARQLGHLFHAVIDPRLNHRIDMALAVAIVRATGRVNQAREARARLARTAVVHDQPSAEGTGFIDHVLIKMVVNDGIKVAMGEVEVAGKQRVVHNLRARSGHQECYLGPYFL